MDTYIFSETFTTFLFTFRSGTSISKSLGSGKLVSSIFYSAISLPTFFGVVRQALLLVPPRRRRRSRACPPGPAHPPGIGGPAGAGPPRPLTVAGGDEIPRLHLNHHVVHTICTTATAFWPYN
jgi:hypothetical protein